MVFSPTVAAVPRVYLTKWDKYLLFGRSCCASRRAADRGHLSHRYGRARDPTKRKKSPAAIVDDLVTPELAWVVGDHLAAQNA